MKILKKLLKARVIVWAAVSVVLVVTLIVANNLAMGRFAPTLDQIFGGKTAITADGETKIDFGQEFETKDEARANGDKIAKKICEEGMVLLKNEKKDGVPALPLKPNEGKIKVSVFGKNSVSLVYGGSGSAAPDKNIEKKTIFDSLTAEGIEYNQALRDFYENKSLSGNGRSENPAMDSASSSLTLKIGETDPAKFTADVTSSFDEYNDAALVVFSRIAGETWDLPRVQDSENGAGDPSRHYLELNNYERKLLKTIADSGKFEHIIILINGSNYIDLGFLEERTASGTDYNDFGKYIDGAIVIGSPGAEGIMALGEILTGKVNPSGHTVDTIYTKYDKDPTWQNFGGNFATAGDTDRGTEGDQYLTVKNNKLIGTDFFLVEYEENIYQGYRYYETADKEAKNNNYYGFDYDKQVVYPFGYGLSYTTFEQEITNISGLNSALNPTEEITVHIRVNNTGTVAGKQVVQLYAEAPYEAGKIEKPYKVLVGFAKTDLIPAGGHDDVTITVNPYDFASFDNHDANGNGKKCWELDAGDYIFHAGINAHEDFDTFTKNLAGDGYCWENDPITNKKVEPLFDDVTEHMNVNESLSRKDFKNTFPKMITEEERTIDTEFIRELKSTQRSHEENDEPGDTMPIMGETPEELIQLKDLFGLEYDDQKWESFLNQMTFDEMLSLFNYGCYSTKDILRLGIPKTTSVDGPTGLVSFLGTILDVGQQQPVYGCCYYQSECLLAQTYNLDLATEQAHAVGNEALIGNERGDGLSYPGWYAPAVNIHRSPFSGRNTEYYSEDSWLNGKFAAKVILGVQEKGVYANLKHYALNDQETHRDAKGIATWCDEQAMRENYLRAFEIAVKEGKPRGLMTSFNRIGTEWAGGSYRLCTKVLRQEWGFVGSIICDYKTEASDYMDSRQMLYGGGDISLCSDEKIMLKTGNSDYDTISKSSAKDANLLRRSAHNNLYALANSCALKVDIIGYKEAPWKLALTGVEWGIIGVIIIWGAAMIVTALLAKEKKQAKADAVAANAEEGGSEPAPEEAPNEASNE